MSDNDIRDQLEGLFSDNIPSPETESRPQSLPEEVIFRPAEAGPTDAELIALETSSVVKEDLSLISEGTLKDANKEPESPQTSVSPSKSAPLWTLGRSIRTRLLVLLLGLVAVTILAVAYLGLSSIQRIGQSAQEISGEALRTQAEDYLLELTVSSAGRNDLPLERVRQDTRNLAQYAAHIFEQPEAFASEKFWRVEDHMFVGPEGQYINGEEDTSTTFVPNSVEIDDKLIADMELAAYLDLQFVPVYDSNPNTVAVYIISESEFSRLYPNINLGAIVPPDFLATKDIFFTSGAPENNPGREVIWTPVYEDPAGQGLLVTAVAPIYTSEGEFLGIIGIDVSLAQFSASIEAAKPIADGYSFLVDAQGRALALPEQGYRDVLGRSPEPGEFGADLQAPTTAFAPILAEMAAGSTGFQTVTVDGRELFVAYAPLPNTGWSLANVVEAEKVLQSVTTLREQLDTSTRSLMVGRILPVGVFIFFVVAAAGTLLANRLVGPIRGLATVAQQIGSGQLNIIVPQTGSDEIGVLYRAFATMVAQLRDLMEGMERRVTERTRARMGLAAQVGRRLSTVRDLDMLLAEAVELIRESFDLYHVQVYLTDPAGRYLALRAGTGAAGKELLRRGHSLPIGAGSINATAAAQKQAVIVSDTAHSAVFLANPLLPETRSEMAVPLLIEERVVGVLDLQAAQPGALAADNLPALEVLAGQLAVAIENARLFAEAAQARAEAEAQAGRLARRGWGEFLDGIRQGDHVGYAYQGDCLEALAEPLAAAPPAHTLAVPLEMQGAPIGAIHVEGEAGQAWTEAEVELVASVARQVAQQAENLRLLAHAEQYRAEAEQASRRLTREGWQAYLESQGAADTGFVYDLYQVRPLTNGQNGGQPALSGALQVRGETIGELTVGQIEAPDDEAADLVAAVAQRLGAHIENMRLIEETQMRRHELEERSQELEASQRVTFAASETGDPDKLLDLVVNLIRDQFDLYHAQVYVADQERETAVLRTGTGYAGRQLLEQGHAIPLETSSPVTQAIREGQPVLVADVTLDKDWQANPWLPHTQSELVVPLKAGDKVVGALDVHSRTPGRFSQHTAALFQSMAEQVAMSFDNADLLVRTTQQAEALTRFTNQLRTAADIAERMNAILDPNQLLSEVVNLLQSRFGLYHAHVYLLEETEAKDETKRQLVVRAGSGEVGQVLCERGHHIPLDAEKSVVARAARSRRTVYVEDTSLKSGFMPNPLLPQTRCELAVPLVSGDVTLGVLDMQDDLPGRFSESDLDTFNTLAGQVATALQNARLFEERKRLEAALRTSEEYYRGVIESQQDAIVRVDSQGRFTFVNDVYCQKFGKTRDELLGNTFTPLVHEDDLQPTLDAMQALYVPPYRVRMEQRAMTPEGWRWFEWEDHSILDGEGNIVEIQGVGRDVTERKQAEVAVRESQQMLQLIMNNIPQSIFWKDKNGVFLGCNRGVVQDAGLTSVEEIVGKTDFDMPWAEQAELYQADDRRVMESGDPVLNYEEPQTTPDGTRIWLRTSKIPLRDAQDKVWAVLGIYEDITERKQAEEDLRKFKLGIERSSDAIFLTNTDGTIVYVNPAFEKIYGYSSEEAVGQTPRILKSGVISREQYEHFWTTLLAKQVVAGEIINKTKDGQLVNIEGANIPILGENENLVGFLVVHRDISERKRAEAELQQTAERLREVDRLKSEFLANMSHELRTPLNSILGYTEVMLLGLSGELDPETLEDAQAIYDNGQHLLRLINDILDLAKIEAGRMTLNLEAVEIASLLEEVRTSSAGLLVNKPVELSVKVQEDLPTIQADRVRLSQILNNLVSNAAKFTDAGSIVLRACRENGWVCLEVEDTGIGIKEADLETIFEQFRQADGSFKRRAEGTGLGLAITRHLVTMHGGTIEVRSQVGQGSTFTVRLPVQVT
jgi:PAS domain S-box-containing protein